jgi:hypothetical protein
LGSVLVLVGDVVLVPVGYVLLVDVVVVVVIAPESFIAAVSEVFSTFSLPHPRATIKRPHAPNKKA